MQLADLNDRFVTEFHYFYNLCQTYINDKTSDNIWNVSDQLDILTKWVNDLKKAVDARNEV